MPSGGFTIIEREPSTSTATWLGTRVTWPSSSTGCSATIRQVATANTRSPSSSAARPRRRSQYSDTAEKAMANPAAAQIRISSPRGRCEPMAMRQSVKAPPSFIAASGCAG